MPRLLDAARALLVEFVPHHLANVAGIDAATFLQPIAAAGFDRMLVPSDGMRAEGAAMLATLEAMIRADRSEDALVFTRASTVA